MTTIASNMSYDISLLMAQTRKLASDYRNETGHALPVTEELARFDAVTLLKLRKIEGHEGVDAVSAEALKQDQQPVDRFLIKGRVIFKGGKARQKLGKLSLASDWNQLLMVIYNADYHPTHIYQVARDIIEQELDKVSIDKRGSMTVAKYKAIGKLIWDAQAKSVAEQNPESSKSS
jgi:hypothetical protein